jgi:ABC-type uncharacterized transport system auxiliary subunit
MCNSKQILAIAIMAVFASLDGCAGKIRYTSYYILNVPAGPSANDPPKPVLGAVAVREFSAPRFLSGGPIAYRPSPEQLDFYNYHRWAEDPRRVVTSAMVREMQARGLFQSVELFDGRGTTECLMTGMIDHLEEIDEGSNVSVQVSLSARLINLRTGAVLWQGASSSSAKLDQRSVPGMVVEMSHEVAETVKVLVSSMQDRLLVAPSQPRPANTEE